MAVGLFAGDLRISATEEFGPKLNSRTVAILHPDMHQTSQDLGRERVSQRRVDRSTYLPDLKLNNLILKDAYTLDENGELKAQNQYSVQKVGPGEPLAAVAAAINKEVLYVESDPVKAQYIVDHYGHTDTGTDVVVEPDKVLYWA